MRLRRNKCNNVAPQNYNELICELKRNALVTYSESDVLSGSKLESSVSSQPGSRHPGGSEAAKTAEGAGTMGGGKDSESDVLPGSTLELSVSSRSESGGAGTMGGGTAARAGSFGK